MRVLLVNEAGARIGGIEVHLRHLLPALQDRGHAIALLYHHPIPAGRESLVPPNAASWCATEWEPAALKAAIQAWAPDVVYAHQLLEPDLVRWLQASWPTLCFIHCYMGVCVSTTKCWKSPRPRPCQRQLGWGCLLHYFPHRCGGLNPWVMWRLFGEQRTAQDLLRRFDLLATHSDYVRDEYRRHGFPEAAIEKVPFWVPGASQADAEARALPETGPLKLLFLGRFDIVKGGNLLLAALPAIAARLSRPVELVMAGNGPEREPWERQALAIAGSRKGPHLRITFPGWLDSAARDAALAEAHLLVVPSVWPEPFGMTGIEAGFQGVPAVAFDVGGVREWLQAGFNGQLAPGDPPSATELAEAIVLATADGARYSALSRGALAATRQFGATAHLEAVEGLLARCRASAGPRRVHA